MVLAWSVFLVLAGFALLYYGGDYMVVGAVRLSARLGVDPVVIGLTVVALGTSLPELLVSVLSALQGHSTVAVGNILGSDIFNLCLIVGISAILANPLEGSPSVARRDMPILIGGMVLFGILGADLLFTRTDGIILVVAFSIYMTWTILDPSPREAPPELYEALEEIDDVPEGEDPMTNKAEATKHLSAEPFLKEIAIGIITLPIGAHILVKGGIDIARFFNISERFIAMTLVSWGTSLPEMATSLAAAYHGHAGLCIGNVVGSNLFNTVAIMGITALITPVKTLAIAMKVDFGLAFAATLLLAFLHRQGREITKRGGVLLLIGFAVMFIVLSL